MKTFRGDLDMFIEKLKNNEHFALSRWGDGELMILENKRIDLRHKGDGEFFHDPDDIARIGMRNVLMKAYKHHDPNYYIGVACKCCVGDEKFQYMKKLSGQPEENLTWANIFVNGNYIYFLTELLPVLNNKKVIMVGNSKGAANVNKLPFKVERYISVGTDAWINNYSISDNLIKEISDFNINDHVFLFAAGPLANILTYELWMHNKSNTYIDIGSTLDKHLGLTLTRGYLNGADTLRKICVW